MSYLPGYDIQQMDICCLCKHMVDNQQLDMVINGLRKYELDYLVDPALWYCTLCVQECSNVKEMEAHTKLNPLLLFFMFMDVENTAAFIWLMMILFSVPYVSGL